MKPLSSAHFRNFHPLLGIREIVAFDLETTGLRHKQEEITQIAAVKLGGIRMEIEDSFMTYVDPSKPIPSQIQKLTRIRDHHVIGAPKPIDGIQALSNFAGDATLFGHDIYRFDFRFISKHLNDKKVPTRTVRFVDTMDVFETLWKDFSRLRNSLDDIAERLSAGLSSIRRHDAQGDAILLAHVFQRIQDHPDLERLCDRIPVHEQQLPVMTQQPGRVSSAKRLSSLERSKLTYYSAELS
ncbi:MAG: 3'-5' exonuclease [Verrucomicrobiota bacterium]